MIMISVYNKNKYIKLLSCFDNICNTQALSYWQNLIPSPLFQRFSLEVYCKEIPEMEMVARLLLYMYEKMSLDKCFQPLESIKSRAATH